MSLTLPRNKLRCKSIAQRGYLFTYIFKTPFTFFAANSRLYNVL